MKSRSHPRSPGARGRLLVEIPLGLLLAVLLSYAVLRHLAGGDSLRQVHDHQVAVLVDHVRGASRVIDTPGTHAFLPYAQEVFVLDRRPSEYVMDGNERKDANHVPRLLVRARDGSSFGFERVVVQYALDTHAADRVLGDSGPGEAFKERLLDAFARSILRDAYGRYTTQEMLLPENRLAANADGKAQLERALGPHGITVLELAVSKPSFSPKFEETIARRQVADQDTEALARQVEELAASEGERLAQVVSQKELEERKVVAAGAAALAKALRAATRKRAEADAFAVDRLAAAQEVLAERLARAARNEERYRQEAEAFRQRTAALAAQGELAVRAALVEQLGSIPFELVPYDRTVKASEAAQ
jgi:regulator of protease activity HflC (stomatin/prohibitin superfamily)